MKEALLSFAYGVRMTLYEDLNIWKQLGLSVLPIMIITDLFSDSSVHIGAYGRTCIPCIVLLR